MLREETGIIVEYFWNATAEHLELMGVDPSRLPAGDPWREKLEREIELPPQRCTVFMLLWLWDETPFGFSTVNRIVYGEEAYMHLHIVSPQLRARGAGAECVRRSVGIYFDALKLKRLYSEPNAFNIAPNRTLQRAGFRYVKTHRTVPGQINFHQAVTRWVYEPPSVQ